MKGVRFYLEYENKTEKNKATVKAPGNHKGTVVAIYLDENNRPISTTKQMPGGDWYIAYDCACGIFDTPNSSITSSVVSDEFLAEYCKRIPERLAREIHPRMFMYLEA